MYSNIYQAKSIEVVIIHILTVLLIKPTLQGGQHEASWFDIAMYLCIVASNRPTTITNSIKKFLPSLVIAIAMW